MSNFSANQTLVKATSYEKKGKADKACGLYLAVLDSFPGNSRALFGLTRTHEFLVSKHLETLWLMLEEGQVNFVLDKAQILAKKFTHAFSLWNLLGASFSKSNRLMESIASYQQALKIKREFPQAINNMANTLLEIGDLDSAVKHYKKAIKIKPDFTNALANLGAALSQKGDFEAAILSYKKAININPSNPDIYNKLAATQLAKGDVKEAVISFNKVIRIDPNDVKAQHLLAASIGTTPDTAPRKYVEGLFDHYAPSFEISLVNKLQYTVPQTLAELAFSNHAKCSLGSILDLGCGTGLMGAKLRQSCKRLEGIDLSHKMLNQAQRKKIYDKLTHVDILEHLKSTELNFDYYFAADVFIYVGDLSELFYLIKKHNKSSGKLLFSTENSEKDGFFLEKYGRYAHSKSYIQKLCDEYDYQLTCFSKVNLRKEGNEFISGGIYLLDF